MTKIITKISKVYDDCNQCPDFQRPDANGEILVIREHGNPYTVKIYKEIHTPEGMKPNPMCGRCMSLGIIIKDTKHPIRKNDTTGFPEITSAYHTRDGECIIEHTISQTIAIQE